MAPAAPRDRPDPIEIRPLGYDRAELAWAEALLDAKFAGRRQVRRDELIDVLDGNGLVAVRGERKVGLLTWQDDGPGRIEVTSLAATEPRTGVGSALVREAFARGRAAGATEIRIVTTNDNVDALAFYEHLGFRLVEVGAGAVDRARRDLKPGIPEVAANGLPIRDELELALRIDSAG